jgi:hypothetical protein
VFYYYYYYYYFDAVEVCLKPSSTARIEDVRLAVERFDFNFFFRGFVLWDFVVNFKRQDNFLVFSLFDRMLEKRSLSYADGPIPVPIDDQFLFENVQRISVCDTGLGFYFSICSIFSFCYFGF